MRLRQQADLGGGSGTTCREGFESLLRLPLVHPRPQGRHITEFAEGENADMLVLGSRGMGGVRRVLGGLMGLGSVSDYVTKHSSTNVVIHKMAAPPK